MRRVLKEHQLLVIMATFLVVVLVLGTWATWFEFSTNETAGVDNHAGFWSDDFLAYWSMQLLMNYAPELMGTITLIIFAAKFRERFGVK